MADKLSQPDARGPYGPRAFTLVEMLIVLALIGTVAAIAIPRHASAVQRRQVEGAAARVASEIRQARRLAMVRASGAVAFDVDAETIVGVKISDGVQDGDRWTVQLGSSPYEADLVSATFGGSNTVVFDGWGLPHAAGTAVVKVGNETRVVTLDGATGMVSIGVMTLSEAEGGRVLGGGLDQGAESAPVEIGESR